MTRYRTLVIFNFIMALFIFLSSQFLLFALNGKIVHGFGLFVDSGFPGNPPPTIAEPLPNYPFLIFLGTLIVNFSYLALTKLKR
jgi:hypothetical protein